MIRLCCAGSGLKGYLLLILTLVKFTVMRTDIQLELDREASLTNIIIG